jgi:chorismate mutase
MTTDLLAAADDADITTVDDGRTRIDAIDGQLLTLLAQRRVVSTRIQQLRVEAGGSRVEHSRENAILRRYSDALGDGGVELALAVLDHCRGPRATGRP